MKSVLEIIKSKFLLRIFILTVFVTTVNFQPVQAGGCDNGGILSTVYSSDYCNNQSFCVNLTLWADWMHGDEVWCIDWGDGTSTCVTPGIVNGPGDTDSVVIGCHQYDSIAQYVITAGVSPAHTTCVWSFFTNYDHYGTTDVDCYNDNNGTITLPTPTNDPVYNYVWNDGTTNKDRTGLSGGSYFVTMTDGSGCTFLDTFNIFGPDTIGINPVLDCTAGTGTVVITGGTPYTPNLSPINYPYAIRLDTVGSLFTTGCIDYTHCKNPKLSIDLGGVDHSDFWGDYLYIYVSYDGGPNQLLFSGTDISGVPDLPSYNNLNFNLSNTATCIEITVKTTFNPFFDASFSIRNLKVTCDPLTADNYYYLWCNGTTTATSTGLPLAGGCQVTVTDGNGCTNTAVIDCNCGLVISTNSGAPDCAGACTGTATATGASSNGGVNYLWQDGQTTSTITGLCAGDYNVTIADVNNCSGLRTISVIDPPGMTLSANGAGIPCFGGTGTIGVTVVGGVPGYTYQWPDGQTNASATGMSPGSYQVVVTDANGCPDSIIIALTSPDQLTHTISDNFTVDCAGNFNGAGTVTPVGGTPPYTYIWCDGQTTQTASGINAGLCNVTVTDGNGCVNINAITFVDPGILTLSVAFDSLNCPGNTNATGTVTGTGGIPPYNYLWCNGQTTANASNLPGGACVVTVTDANGCPQTIAANIYEPNGILANATGFDANCFGGSDGGVTLGTTGGTPPYSYVWSDGQTTSTPTGLTAGSYTVTITDANGCTDTDVIAIGEPTVITAGITTTNSSCGQSDGSATATGSGGTPGYTYTWPNGQTTALSTGLSAGSYVVTVTDSKGCPMAVTANVSDALAPSLAINGSNLLCFGDAVGTAGVTVSGGTPGYTYQWDDPNSSIGTSLTGLVSGTYNVTVTDATGCIATNSYVVTEPTLLVLTPAGTDETCDAINGVVSVGTTGGVPGYTYTWDDPSSSNTATVGGLGPGTYNVTVTDANGCSDIASVTIIGHPSPTSTVTGTGITCNGGTTGTATVTGAGGTPGLTYQWNDPNNSTTTTITGLGAGTYIATVTDANGCTAINSYTVIDPPAINATPSSTNETCTGTNGMVGVTVTGGTGGVTYQWDDPNSSTTATVTGLPGGTYSVTITDINGCTDITSVIITDEAAPTATVTGTDIVCNANGDGSVAAVPNGGTPGYTYQWDDPNSSTTSTLFGLSGGTYTVTITDANGCVAINSYTVAEPAVLTLGMNNSNALCGITNGGTAIANVVGGTPGYSYIWSTNAGGQTTASAGGLLSSGTYCVTITDQNNCSKTDCINVDASPKLTMSAGSVNIACNGANDGTGTVTVWQGTPGYTYQWDDPNSQTSATATGLVSGAYNVTVTDSYGCTAMGNITITEPPVFVFGLGSDTSTCNNRSIVIGGPATGGSPGYIYTWSDGSTTPSITINNNGTPYSVTVTDASGCTIIDDIVLGSDTLPLPDFDVSFIPTCEGLKGTFVNNTTGGQNYYWDFGDGTTSDVFDPTHVFDYGQVITIKLIAYNGGCADSTFLTDSILDFGDYQNFKIPNVFTPNGDGINDYFEILTVGDLSECTFLKVIMNRWGTTIYEPPLGRLSWDGHTTAGVEVPEGTYYYLVQVKDTEFKGWVHLIKGSGKSGQ